MLDDWEMVGSYVKKRGTGLPTRIEGVAFSDLAGQGPSVMDGLIVGQRKTGGIQGWSQSKPEMSIETW